MSIKLTMKVQELESLIINLNNAIIKLSNDIEALKSQLANSSGKKKISENAGINPARDMHSQHQ